MDGPAPMRSIAVTGATGFIGGAIVRELSRQGYSVRVLIRPNSIHKPMPDRVDRVVGTLEDVSSLQALLSEVDSVVHCAGAVRGAHESTFARTNSEAVSTLVQLAAECPNVRRFLLLSSLVASQPHVSPYAMSKLGGEQALATQAADMACLALRPPAVYGPGDRELLPLFRAMTYGLAPLWARRDARFSLLYVTDLVAAVAQWISSSNPISGVYDLHDGHDDGYTMDEIIEIATNVLNRRIRGLQVPAAVLDILAGANIRCARLVNYEPMLTPWKLQELRYPRWVCDNSKFARATGWVPTVPFTEGIQLALSGE